ncbi:MAG: sigma-70 family RNA polymerase sigma factor [Chlorobi bacterium]|nr:sigma-70 family RNA polymerase sigma factor [Chlorobiota bacterium]
MRKDRLSKEEVMALVQRVAQGDNEAFATLYQHYYEPLLSYMKSFINDEMLAEDMTQDTFIKAQNKIMKGQYQERGRFFQWLCQVGRNMYIDHYRRKKVRGVGPMPAWTEEDTRDTFFATDEGRADFYIEEKETKELIRELLSQLPEDQRKVVEMKIYEGLTFREIAEKTGVNINTTLGRMRYALEKMRKAIKKRKEFKHIKIKSKSRRGKK